MTYDNFFHKSYGLFMLALVFVWLFGVGDRPFSTPDEARYVEIPREMVTSGDWVTPRLNGVKYFEKPPLLYWMQASVQSVGASPTHEGWMRFPTLMMAIIGLIATWAFARKTTNELTAHKSVWILATCVLYFAHSRLITIDMTLTSLIMMAFYSFYLAMNTTNPTHQRLYMYGASVTAALGVMAKGIVVLALLGPVWVVWLTLERAWSDLRYIPTSILLFLAIVVPWHVLCGLKNSDFWHKYFWVEHVMRYTTTVHARYQPIWYFIPITFVGFLPWSVMWPRIKTLTPLTRYLVLWAGWVLLFYSFSNSKLIPYVLPVMAPCALIWAMHATVKRWHGWVWMILGGSIIFAPMFFGELYDTKQALLMYLYIISFILVTIGACTIFKPSWYGVSIGSLALMLTLQYGAEALQKPSIKPLIPHLIEQQKKYGGVFASWRTYMQDLPVYTQQRVDVIDAMNELEYGAYAENTSSWIYKIEDLPNRLNDSPRYLVGRMADKQYLPNNYTITYNTAHFFVAIPNYVMEKPLASSDLSSEIANNSASDDLQP